MQEKVVRDLGFQVVNLQLNRAVAVELFRLSVCGNGAHSQDGGRGTKSGTMHNSKCLFKARALQQTQIHQDDFVVTVQTI